MSLRDFPVNPLPKSMDQYEVLAFPLQQGQIDLVDAASEAEGHVPLLKHEWFFAGLAISLLTNFVAFLSVFGIGEGSYIYAIDLTRYNIVPWALLMFDFSPWLVGWNILVPTDVLIAAVVGYVVFWVIYPALLYNLGAIARDPFPGIMSGHLVYYLNMHGGWWTALDHKIWWADGVGKLTWGLLLGFVLLSIWAGRKHLLATIRGILSPTQTAEEEEEPLSYRWIWLGTMGTFLLLVICGIAIGVPIAISALVMVFVIWQWIGTARLRAETGDMAGLPYVVTLGGGGKHSPGEWVICSTLSGPLGIQSVNIPNGGAPDANYLAAFSSGYWYLRFSEDKGGGAHAFPAIWVMDAYKLGAATRTRSRDIFLAMIIAVIIGGLIHYPLTIWATYNFGLSNIKPPGGWAPAFSVGRPASIVSNTWGAEGIVQWWNPPTTQLAQASVSWWVIGVAIVIVCMFLRRRYPKFRFNPIGLLYVLVNGFWWFGMLLALIIKVLTFRVGGTKLYEKKMVPLAYGLFSGLGIIMMWQWFMAVIRWV